jgi:GntR family transcriptional regulator
VAKTFIDPNSQRPIFQQIIDEVERRILTGELKPGSLLTSVREFAVEQTVNPNTVSKAYQQLQVLGLVEPIRGTGLRIKEIESRKGQKRKTELLTLKIDECLDLAKSLGNSPQQLIDLIRERSRK